MQSGLNIDPQNIKGPAKIKSALTCPICSMMLQQPIMRCQDCGNYFCQNCLQDWWKKEGTAGKCIYKCSTQQLKIVKRESTLSVMLQLLQFPCQNMGCDKTLTHETLKKHIDSCQFAVLRCQNCNQFKIRKQMQEHDSVCQSKLVQCAYCQNLFSRKDLQIHQQKCPDKLIKCKNEGCDQMIKLCQLPSHQQSCDFQHVHCEWCQKQSIKKQIKDHIQICNSRKSKCMACQQEILQLQLQSHIEKCQLIRVPCVVCDNSFYRKDLGTKHLLNECMISTIKQLRRQNILLRNSNIDLKLAVQNLNNKFDELQNQKNREFNKANQIKNQEYAMLRKDLLRIDNSIMNTEKMKMEENNAHLKNPHILGSWCITCKQSEKRYQKLLEPLVQQRRQVLDKLVKYKANKQ